MTLDKQPSTTQKSSTIQPIAMQERHHATTDAQQWIALDDEQEWSTFSTADQQNSGVWESNLAIDGMHCAACAINVENALTSLVGVLSAHVNAASGRAKLIWDEHQVKPSDWMHAIADAGYRALPASEFFAQDARRREQRKMLWRLLVAAFCMAQVMMYSVPIYYAEPGAMSIDTLNLMRWAAWVLSLPVILFSCGPFFHSALIDLKKGQISMDLPVAIGISITFLVSSAVVFSPNGWWGNEVYFDSLTMLVFFLLAGRWLTLRMHNQTAGALDVLMRRLPPMVERLTKKGEFKRVPVSDLKVSDYLRVLPGEAFPADGILKAETTAVDESLLTGESRPVHKQLGDQVITGSHNLTNAVEIEVTAVGASTRYAQIVTLMEQAAVGKPRLALLADRIAKPFLVVVLFAATLTALYLWHVNPSRALMVAVSILIVTCPCALSLATPAAMLSASGTLAKLGVMVRKIQALEVLDSVDTIVFDKTGTLTYDTLAIGNIKTAECITEQDALALAAVLAQSSLHPVSRAIVHYAKLNNISVDEQVHEIKETAGAGLKALRDGSTLKLGNADFCEIALDNNIQGRSSVYLVSDNKWLATFEIHESVKADAQALVTQLKQQDLQLEIASGDQQPAVEMIGNGLGIKNINANCSPSDKLQHIQSLQKQGRRVLMVGDGLNDGPVLAAADASIALGQAVPLAQAQSDFVIMSGNLTQVGDLIQHAKRTMRIVKQNLLWAAIYNAICVPLAILGMLPAWLAGLGMALSSVLVILNARRLSQLKQQ